MEKKQVVVISLLLIAVLLSSASVILDIAVLKNVNINELPPEPSNGNIEFSINSVAETEITNGENNEI